jgi:hypothetical protein
MFSLILRKTKDKERWRHWYAETDHDRPVAEVLAELMTKEGSSDE